MIDILRRELSKQGCGLGVMDASRLPDVKRDFDERGIDTSPYFDFTPRSGLGFTARSILAVASPSPLSSAVFTVSGNKRKVVIPPSYVNAGIEFSSVERCLTEVLRQHGYGIARGRSLPCKPIAVHSGLGVYGRNNLVYVDGLGSFHNIFLFFTDMPCDEDAFRPKRLMDDCRDCRRCLDNCPTAALSRERELVDADRCLTSLNEHGEDFPDWIEQDWHNALVGCVRCQIVCPVNRPYITTINEAASYDENETLALINGELSQEALEPLGIKPYNKVLPRNLTALLNRGSGG